MTKTKELKCVSMTSENILSFSEYLGEELLDLYKEDECFGFGLLEGHITAGVIFCRENIDDLMAEILQLYVDEEVRRRGGGRLLIAHAAAEAAIRDLNVMGARLELTGEEVFQAFFAECGFNLFEEEDAIMAVMGLSEDYSAGDRLLDTEDGLIYGEEGNADSMVILTSIQDILSDCGLSGVLNCGNEDAEPEILLDRGIKDAPVRITATKVSEEADEYAIMFAREKGELKIMGISTIGGMPQEDEFVENLAEFLRESEA